MMAKSKNKLSASGITSILNSAKFNPNKIGPLKGIAEIGETAYYEGRIKELLGEVKLDPNNYERNMLNIIRLAALSIIWHEGI